MATITFDQAGLSPPGITNRSRSDGKIDGSKVTITVDQSGTVTFIDVPEGDINSVSSLVQTASPLVWEFTPTAGVAGSWLVQFKPSTEGVDPVRRVFAVRTSEKGLRIPAFNERASSDATIATGASFVDESDDNEGGTYRGWARSLAELYRTVANGLFTANKIQESGGPATLNVSTIPASGVLRRNSSSQIVGGPVLVDNAGNITGAGTINGITPAALTNTAPVAVVVNGALTGVALDAARSDHQHSSSTAAPVALAIGGSNTIGNSNSLARANHVHAMPGLATGAADGFMPATAVTKLAGISDGADVTLTALSTAVVDISVNNRKITGLANPTNALDAATKGYADAVTQGLDVKQSCRVIATTNQSLAGTPSIDGVAVIAGDRVLCAGQLNGWLNGIYVAAAGAWARATDADTSAEVTSGIFTFIVEGTANADSGWVLITIDPIVLGTTPLVFTQFSGAGQIQAGTGLTKSGNTLNVGANADGSIVVAADDVKVGVLATDAQHGNRGGGPVHALATTGVAGFMDPADKAKLDGLTANVVGPASSVINSIPVFADGTGKLLKAGSGITIPSPYTMQNVTSINGVNPTAWVRSTFTAFTDNAVTRFDGAGGGGGHDVQDSAVIIDDTGNITGAGTVNGMNLTGTATPAAEGIGSASAVGSATTFARSDHLHAMPSLVTTSVDGFMLAADKVKLNGIATNAAALATNPPTQISVITAAAGGSGLAAKEDHAHSVLVAAPVTLLATSSNTQGTSQALSLADHAHSIPLLTVLENALLPPLQQLRLSSSQSETVCQSGTFDTVHLTPYTGDKIALWYNNKWNLCTANNTNKVLGGLGQWQLYDVFAYTTDGSNVLLELGPQWANDSARNTGIVRTDGVWTKIGDKTRRYVGTFRSSSGNQFTHTYAATDGNVTKNALWNVDNQLQRSFLWYVVGNPGGFSVGGWNFWGGGIEAFHGIAKVGHHPKVILACQVWNTGTTDTLISIGKNDANPQGLRATVSTPGTQGPSLFAQWDASGINDPPFGFYTLRPLIKVGLASTAVMGLNAGFGNQQICGMHGFFFI